MKIQVSSLKARELAAAAMQFNKTAAIDDPKNTEEYRLAHELATRVHRATLLTPDTSTVTLEDADLRVLVP